MNDINTSIKLLTANCIIAILQVHLQDELEYYKRQTQRNAFMQQMQLMSNAFFWKKFGLKRRKKKRWWVKKRNSGFNLWDRIIAKQFTQKEWLSYFRMSSGSFKYICRRLRPHLCAKKRWVRKPLSVQKKVAIALYKLGSCTEYRLVADQFGTNKCVVHKCVYDFCKAAVAEFSDDFLVMPDEHEAEEISTGFQGICGIPNIIGAIGGTHVPIMPPTIGGGDFVNTQGWASYNVMAVVDNLHMFRHTICHHPGSTPDAHILKECENLIPKGAKSINGEDVPYLILGKSAHPQLPWLLTGYEENTMIDEEDIFNARIERGRTVVENTFDRLKARFRCLLKRLDINYKFVPKVVLTCIILHNIVERREDVFVEKWLEDVREAQGVFPQPNKIETREFDEVNVWRLGDETPIQFFSGN